MKPFEIKPHCFDPVIRKVPFLPEDIAHSCHNLPYFSYLKSPYNSSEARYSIIGLSPHTVLRSTIKGISLDTPDASYHCDQDIFSLLDSLIKSYTTKNNPSHLPITAGFMGYFAYDLIENLESVVKPAKDTLSIPDSIWVLHDILYIHDHHTGQSFLSAVTPDESDSKSATERANQSLNHWIRRLTKASADSNPQAAFSRHSGEAIGSSMSKEEYLSSTGHIQTLIRRGDLYQANLSYRYMLSYSGSAFELFRALSATHPTPYSAYFNFPDFQVLSFSPERLAHYHAGDILVQPMKGTRPRSEDPVEDQKLKDDLLSSPKDAAELLMIVDLLRNDLGRVSDFGSVTVEKLKVLESYPTVHQLTARIRSRIKPGYSVLDIVRGIFPSGSITGCPKIRAINVLSSLEGEKRSIFMGSLGYMSFHDTMDLSVAIRTAVKKDGRLYFQVGGGIVHDSVPESEYEETLTKSRFFLRHFTDAFG